jgi:hypothetical protein
MAKKATPPKEKKPRKGAEEIPQEEWDKFDDLLDKALGVEKKDKGKKVG